MSDKPTNIFDNLYNNQAIGIKLHEINIDLIDDAPEEWNFFDRLNEFKMQELKESILENGLLHAPVVWQKEDKRYTMLSGHNRKNVYQQLFEETQNEKYKKMFCYVKMDKELTEDEARSIIIDTNFVQRQLSHKEKEKSVAAKYDIVGRRKRNSRQEDIATVIGKDLKIKRSQVYTYRSLRGLIAPLSGIIGDKLTLEAGAKLAKLNKKTQEQLYAKQEEIFSDKKISKKILKIDINSKTTYDQLLEQINEVEFQYRYHIDIDKEHVERLKEFLRTWEDCNLIKNL